MDSRKRFIQFISRFFSETSANDVVVMALVSSVFISVFFSAALMVLLPLYILISRQWKKALPSSPFEYFLLLFSIIALISTCLYARDAQINSFLLKADYLKLLGIGIVLLSFDVFFFTKIVTKRSFDLGLKLSAWMSVSSFLVAVIQKCFGWIANPARPGRFASVFSNENYYGTVIEFMVLICIYLFFRSQSRKGKLLYFGILILNLLGLWFCQTRAAYITIAAALFLFFFIYKRRTSYVILGMIAAAGVLLIFFPQILPRFDSASEYLRFRFGIWEASLRCIKEHLWIGQGYYSYSTIWKVYSNVRYFALHAHNLYIEMLLNFGILGTASLGLYCAERVWKCVRNAARSRNSLDLALILSSLASILIHGIADLTIFWPQTGFFAVFLLTLPQAYLSDSSKEKKL